MGPNMSTIDEIKCVQNTAYFSCYTRAFRALLELSTLFQVKFLSYGIPVFCNFKQNRYT